MNNRTLNDYCEFIVDCLHKTAPIEDGETGYYSIRTPDIGSGRLLIENANRVSKETYEKWTIRAVPQAGDLILAREAPVGNVGIVQENIKVCCGQRTVHIRPDKTKIYPDYLVYLMMGDEIQGIIKGQSQGATVAHLNMEDIRALILPELPPLPIQRKIADIISAYDDLIEVNTSRIRILEQMAQSVYREWFGKVDGKSLPRGWEIKKLEDEIHIYNGFAFKSEDYSDKGTIIVRTKDFSSSGYIQIDGEIRLPDELLGTYRKFLLQNLDFLLIMVGASLGKYGVVFSKDLPALQNQNMWALRPNESSVFSKYYLIYFLPEVISQVNSFATGAARSFYRKEFFYNYEILVPPIELLRKFDDVVGPIIDSIGNSLEKNANLRRTRDLLLPRLVSGEVGSMDRETSGARGFLWLI